MEWRLIMEKMNMSSPSATAQFSYDEVPYESYCYKNTHPDNLYVIGKIFGMTPPDLRTGRTLEIGCAAGGNLFPLALLYPEAEFVGIDLSAEEIAEANRYKKELGLKNITFLQKDITEADQEFGTFDYIICHGVFSWVPDIVREKILHLCRDNLSPHGIAMISYNAYPGWHFVGAVRGMMKHHAQAFKTPAEKIMQARALLTFLSDNMPKDQKLLKNLIDNERDTLSKVNDTYIYHDHLAGLNQPFWLHEFAAMLKDNDLQYLGDTTLSSMYIKNLPPAAAQQLARLPDIVQQEQYADFLCNRRFRMSLVTHKGIKLDRTIVRERIFDFCFTSNMKPEQDDPDITQPVTFKKKEGAGQFKSTEPAMAAMILALNDAAPMPLSFDELAAAIRDKYSIDDTARARASLLQIGMELALSGLIDLHAAPEKFTRAVSAKPVAYAIARMEARHDPDRVRLTNATRDAKTGNRFSNMLLAYCDGTNDVAALREKMFAHVKKGKVVLLDQNGVPAAPHLVTKEMIDMLVARTLEQFASQALLTG
jgi:methyltransferase-like protein/2-polyprenyl-3-methyl-5-hydroxy-6-metoxy-1,4-benzoquinol methylase